MNLIDYFEVYLVLVVTLSTFSSLILLNSKHANQH